MPSSASTRTVFFARHLDLDREHVAFLKGPVVGQGVRVLLVAPQGHGIALFAGDPGFLADVFGGLDHGVFGPGVAAEVVHQPVFGNHLAARAVGVGPDGVGAVGAAVGHQAVNILVQSGLDADAGLKNTGGRGGAGLADGHAGGRLGPHHGRGPRAAVKPLGLADGDPQNQVVEHRGVPLFLGQPALGRVRRPARCCVRWQGIPASGRRGCCSSLCRGCTLLSACDSSGKSQDLKS